MGPLIVAWLVGEGIIIFRSVKQQKAPPGPGQLLLSSGVFVLLALLAENTKGRSLATTLAFGFDLAAFMNLYGTGKPKTAKTSAWPPGKAPDTVIFPVSYTGSLGSGKITSAGKGGSNITNRENSDIIAGNQRVGL